MKINEIVTEGILGTVAGVAGNVAKGIGKGVADAIAPGAVDKIKGAKYAYDNRVRTSSADADSEDYQTAAQARDLHTKMLSDRGLRDKLQAAANKLEQQARANGNTIDPEDVRQGMHDAGLAEAIRESVDSDAEYHYLVSLLQNAGVTVKGYVAPSADAEAAAASAASAASAVSMARMATATAASAKFKFVSDLKALAASHGNKISMSEIGTRVGVTGEYADPTRHTEAVNHVAEILQRDGITITGIPATPATGAPALTPSYRRTPPATAPLPTIGGIGPSDPRYAALAARTRHAPPTPTV